MNKKINKNKKKVIVCTALFSIVICSILIGSYFIESAYGFSLFDIIAPTICFFWCGERARDFYDWLTDSKDYTDDN